jgi:hypothetical protein
MSGFGFVVDDRSPDKVAAGGAPAFAAQLAEKPCDETSHAANCRTCKLLEQPFACVGVIETPLPAKIEEWLVQRLPDDLESVGGFLLRKAIGDFGYDGARARELRQAGRLEAPGPFERHYGPFFRRFVVSSEQILEELLCAGDVAPAHALAVLMHLGAIDVDGAVPTRLEEGDKLGALIENPAERQTRSRCNVAAAQPMGPLLRAFWAGFVLDCDVFVIDSES